MIVKPLKNLFIREKLLGLMMVLAMAGAFMTLSMDQSHGEPAATMSNKIEVAGSGCAETCYEHKTATCIVNVCGVIVTVSPGRS